MNKMLNELDLPITELSNEDKIVILQQLGKDLSDLDNALSILVEEKTRNENR